MVPQPKEILTHIRPFFSELGWGRCPYSRLDADWPSEGFDEAVETEGWWTAED